MEEILKLDPFLKLGKPAKIAGYFGGKVDLIMMRIVDIISTIPLTPNPACRCRTSGGAEPQ